MKPFLFITILLFNILCPLTSRGSYETVGPERIYLHTDRNSYIAGEYLYYKMYLQGNPLKISRYAYLILRDQYNSIVTHIRLEIKNQRSYGSILLPDTLNSGFYQIVCYTDLMRNEEDILFRKEIVIANRFDEKLDRFTGMTKSSESGTMADKSAGGSNNRENLIIHLQKQVYNLREKIEFSFESKDMSEGPIASLSVSISEVIPGIPSGQSISDYFRTKTDTADITESKSGQQTFLPELNGTILRGKVITSPQPAIKRDGFKSYTIFLSTIDSIANLQYTSTDSLGAFALNIDPYYEGKEIIITTKEKISGVIELDDNTKIKQPYKPSVSNDLQGLKNYLARTLKINQVKKYYSKRAEPDTLMVFVASKAIPRVYYKNYLKILPSDYIELGDFAEISKEIIPAFKVRKINDTFNSGFTNLQHHSGSDDEPIIFLDGVPIDNVSQIIELGSNHIKSIESLPVVRYYGKMSFNGILSVVSKNMAINNVRFNNPAIRIQALSSQPFTKPRLFNPEYLPKKYPDLRQVLLWEPELIPDNSGKQEVECFASDLKGKYLINMQGITTKGYPLCGSAIITIQSK
jgi:hypothetical protein